MTISRPLSKIREPEIWKRYLDTDYYVSDQGRAKRIYANGREYEVGWWNGKKVNPQMCMKINGKDIFMKTIIWKTFKGEIPKGYLIAHKNGLKRDNSIYNLYLTKPKDLGIITGHKSKSQKVINRSTGRIYRSAREAGKKLYCSYQTIMDICNGKTKKPLVDVYWWDDENERAFRGKYDRGSKEII